MLVSLDWLNYIASTRSELDAAALACMQTMILAEERMTISEATGNELQVRTVAAQSQVAPLISKN